MRFFIFFIATLVLVGCVSDPLKEQPVYDYGDYTVTHTEEVNPPALPGQIAVLLPLSGPSSSAGQAVLRGLLATYYQPENSETQPRPKLKIFDTHTYGARIALQKAVKAEADFIIGPLTHQAVQAVSDSTNIKIPWLMLNYTDSGTPGKNIYQMGLSIRNEVDFLASEAFDAGYRKALIFSEDTHEQAFHLFSDAWESLGAQVIKTVNVSKKTNINAAVAKALLINESKGRSIALQKTLSEKLDFIPRARKDIDMVFIAGSKRFAQQINPALKFYFAGSLPVFTLSDIYDNSASPYANKDLEGVRFSSPAWRLHSMPLLKQVKQFWPGDTGTNIEKLYILGANSGYIYPSLFRFDTTNSSTTNSSGLIKSYGGQVFINDKHQIYQHLSGVTLKQGKIVMEPLIAKTNNQVNDKQ